MDNTGFILAFLRDLEGEMKKIGLKSAIDLKILKNDMFLEDSDTLGVMFVKGIPMYIVTSKGRVKILNEKFRGKNIGIDEKNNFCNLFFQKYSCTLTNYKLNGSSLYSIKRVPSLNLELADIKLVRNFDKNEESRRKTSLVAPIDFDYSKRLKMGLEVKKFIIYELEYLRDIYNPKNGFYGIEWYHTNGKLCGNIDSNIIYINGDDINNIGNLIEMAIVNIGLPSVSFTGDIRDFCYTILSGLRLYIDDINLSKPQKDKVKKLLNKYIEYFSFEPDEVIGLDFKYIYDKTFLNGISTLEIVSGKDVLYGVSNDGNITIDKYNGMVLERRFGKRSR